MKLLLSIATCLLSLVTIASAEELATYIPSFRPLETRDVVPELTFVDLGRPNEIAVNVLVANKGCDRLCNPFLDGSKRLPARVLVFDAEKKYVGDLLIGAGHKSQEIKEDERIIVSSELKLGRRLRIRIGQQTKTSPLSDSEVTRQVEVLGPWTYHFQSVYTSVLKHPSLPSPLQSFATGSEIARSDLVRLTLPLRSPMPCSGTEADGVRVEAQCKFATVFSDERVHLEVRYVNLSDRTVELFNPALNDLCGEKPLALYLTDGERRLPEDLIAHHDGSKRRISEQDWLRVPPGGVIQTTESGNNGWHGNRRDVKGYGLELVVFDRLTIPCPPINEADPSRRLGKLPPHFYRPRERASLALSETGLAIATEASTTRTKRSDGRAMRVADSHE